MFIKLNVTASFIANGAQEWKLANIPFESQTKFRYIFHGIRGDPSNSTGGISIDDISLTETRCPTNIWQIRNFISIFNSTTKGDYISSPLFYNSEGYCFVLKLYPHGLSSSTSGDYFRIGFSLCSSLNDGALEWPAGNRQVTFTIVDQDPDITQRMSSSRSFTTDPTQLFSKFKGSVVIQDYLDFWGGQRGEGQQDRYSSIADSYRLLGAGFFFFFTEPYRFWIPVD